MIRVKYFRNDTPLSEQTDSADDSVYEKVENGTSTSCRPMEICPHCYFTNDIKKMVIIIPLSLVLCQNPNCCRGFFGVNMWLLYDMLKKI